MKTGKLIIGETISQINFNENPSIILEENENENRINELTGYYKYNPFKFNLISSYSHELLDGEYNNIFIIPTNDFVAWKLLKCKLNLELSEILFESSVLYTE